MKKIFMLLCLIISLPFAYSYTINEVNIEVQEPVDGSADAIVDISYSVNFFENIWLRINHDRLIENFIEKSEKNLDTELELLESDVRYIRLRFHDFAKVIGDTYYTYGITAYEMEKLKMRFPDGYEVDKEQVSEIEAIKHTALPDD